MAMSFDVAVVCFDEGFSDGETDAGAAVLAVSGSVDAIKAIEEPGEVFWSDSIPGIGDRHR